MTKTELKRDALHYKFMENSKQGLLTINKRTPMSTCENNIKYNNMLTFLKKVLQDD